MDKKTIRRIVTEQKRMMDASEIKKRSEKLCRSFFELEEYKQCGVICCYASYNQEVRTDMIIDRALREGKKVACAKVIDKGLMEFVYIDSRKDLEPGAFGIPEPKDSLLEAGPDRIANEKYMLVLMPGLAFDINHNRVGYGGGYYDRYFDSHPDTEFVKVALCFGFQVFDEVPHEEHDYKVDILITD